MSKYVDRSEFEKLEEKLKLVYEHLGLDFTSFDDALEPDTEHSLASVSSTSGKLETSPVVSKEERRTSFEWSEQEKIDLGTGAIELIPEDLSPEGWNSINDDDDAQHVIALSLERKPKNKLIEKEPIPEIADHTNKITFDQHKAIFSEDSNLSMIAIQIPLVKSSMFNAVYDVDDVDNVINDMSVILHSSNGEISEKFYDDAYIELDNYKFTKAKTGEMGYENQTVDNHVDFILGELKRRLKILNPKK